MNELYELSVLRNLMENPVFSAVLKGEIKSGKFLHDLFDANAQDNLTAYLYDLVKYDDNAFSRACAKNPAAVSPYLKKAFARDLRIVGEAVSSIGTDGRFCLGDAEGRVGLWDDETIERLSAFYERNGYGKYARYFAFRFTDRELVPISSPSTVSLGDLKGYEREKEEVRENFENFAEGLPFSDMLLYGDRGTGKSSTVHAMLNLYRTKKIRLVEIAKEDILSLPALKAKLAVEPVKFAIFIDDFSLSEDDGRVSTLKASLQGSMEGLSDNVMIVATSNRRHIVEENFDTRQNSIHTGDSEQELLSLADRFGKTVLFSQTTKEQYRNIVIELAKDSSLKTSPDELSFLAERWALYAGGRSPRRARQFI
ncbi:MAG: DUF815 domain-containing protein, partial [Candidatus Gallimonas sp.]